MRAERGRSVPRIIAIAALVTTMLTAPLSAQTQETMQKLENELVAKYGEGQRARAQRGIRQVAQFWRAEDGDEAAFEALVRTHFAGDQQTLDIFLDTQGPQITGMVPNPSLTKPTAPSPNTTMITLTIRDRPNRTAAFPNPAANPTVVVNPGHYRLVGDTVGLVPIQSVTFTPDPIVVGQPATGTIKLTFFEPLPEAELKAWETEDS
jgi:hypothetical protein